MSAAPSTVSPADVDEKSPLPVVGLLVLLSMALHGGLFYGLSRLPSGVERPLEKPIDMVMFEVEPPKPPEPEPEVERPPPPKVKPPPLVKVNSTKVEPPPPSDAPPPPNEEAPPPEAEQPKPVVVIGLTMSSTSTAGGFAAPVGNSAYGRPDEKAVAPEQVKAYSAPKYTPIYQVDTEPSVVNEAKVPYPEEARRAGVEGVVVLSITVDESGNVVDAKVLSGPGYGLEAAALRGIKQFKFKPAKKHGEAVSTELKYRYRFTLD